MFILRSPFHMPRLAYHWNYYFLTQPRQPSGFSYFYNQDPYGFYSPPPISDLNTNAVPFVPSPKQQPQFDHLDRMVDYVLDSPSSQQPRKKTKFKKFKYYRRYYNQK
jgi:hypothetical protein